MQNKENQVRLRPGNSKMGKVFHVNLPPCKTCDHTLPCYSSEECYALKAWRQYPGTRKAWMHNWDLFQKSPDQYFKSIADQIKRKKSLDMFRWHSAGDLVNYKYLCNMYAMAHEFPDIKFMAFTKKYKVLADEVNWRAPFWKAPNMTLVISAWPGLKIPVLLRRKFPIAWMEDSGNPDKRIPHSAVECSGQCDECMLCWRLTKGQSVFFHKH